MIMMHYLVINRNHIFVGGIRLYYYCLLVVKRETYWLVLCAVVILGDVWFFLGTDSALHADDVKESACGCAGCFTAINIMLVLAQVFEDDGVLDWLVGFVVAYGVAFYGVVLNFGILMLVWGDMFVYWFAKIDIGVGPVIVFDLGFLVYWQVAC